MVKSRSAMASRTSASWQIATIAVPLSLAFWINSITTARFSASSEAVGSSSSRIGWPAMKPRARLTRCCSAPEEGVGGGDVHHFVAVADEDAAAVGAVVAVQAAHQGGFAGPGRAGEDEALTAV